MLTRVSIREQTTHAIDGVCIVSWFENRLMVYLHYCGYQEPDKEGQENSEYNNSSEDEDEEEGVKRGRMHAIGEGLSSAIDLNDPGRTMGRKENGGG